MIEQIMEKEEEREREGEERKKKEGRRKKTTVKLVGCSITFSRGKHTRVRRRVVC